jgi:CheY-like chemotaxis protein/HPt (histidine-containing phosphotransfer) domain-containing protein
MSFSNVDVVEGGETAIFRIQQALSKEAPYDLILLDWKMEGIDGVAAAQKIRKLAPVNEQPIIFLISAYGEKDIIDGEHSSLFDGFLYKPLNSSTLLERVHSVLLQRSKTTPAVHKGKGRILVVEDNVINMKVISRLLTKEGFSLAEATDGQMALNLLHEQEFDLILMDIRMPGMTGLEASEKIRQLPKLKHIPIIAMTAQALPGDREKCFAAGMTDYITKPIGLDELCTMLDQYLPESNEEKGSLMPISDNSLDFPEIEGLDCPLALERMQGDIPLYLDILSEFYFHILHFYLNDEEQLLSMEHITIADTLHSLQGTASNVEANEIRQKLNLFETDLRENQQYPSFDQLKELRSILVFQLEQLDAFVAGPSYPRYQENATVASREAIDEYFSTLFKLFQKNNDRSLFFSACKYLITASILSSPDFVKHLSRLFDQRELKQIVNTLFED